jgi:hypothetical protein
MSILADRDLERLGRLLARGTIGNASEIARLVRGELRGPRSSPFQKFRKLLKQLAATRAERAPVDLTTARGKWP